MLFPKHYPVRPSVRCNHVICGLEKTDIEPVGAWRFRDRPSGCHYAKRARRGCRGLSSEVDLHELTRPRAEEICLRKRRIPGRDVENWRQAEQEIRAELEQASRRTAIIVRVSGVQYVGEYSRDDADGYTPGEYRPGVPVPVRPRGDKMFVRRPNGKLLETRIVKQIESVGRPTEEFGARWC
jgi:hypothetical protein